MSPTHRPFAYLYLDEFRGASLLDSLQLYNEFNGLGVPEKLKQVPEHLLRDPEYIINNFLEYAILEWLSFHDMSIGYKPSHTISLISGGGSSGVIPANLEKVPTLRKDDETNLLIKARPLEIPLPKGSKIIRSSSANEMMTIKTRYSRITIRTTGSAGEPLVMPIEKDTKKIYEVLRLPNNPPTGIYIYGYAVEFETYQFPFYRFSKQAKIEAEWFKRLEYQFERDFSWERLKKFLISGDESLSPYNLTP